MKKAANFDLSMSIINKQRGVQLLLFIGIAYVLMMSLEVPFVFRNSSSSEDYSQDGNFMYFNANGFLSSKNTKRNSNFLESEIDLEEREAPIRPVDEVKDDDNDDDGTKPRRERKIKEIVTPLSDFVIDDNVVKSRNKSEFGGILMVAKDAFDLGKKMWEEIDVRGKEGVGGFAMEEKKKKNVSDGEACPHSLSVTGGEWLKKGKIMEVPCGLTLGSHITVVGRPGKAHWELNLRISRTKKGIYVELSQFTMELLGLKVVDGEDPPRILHFNPRLKGDWSGKPVIEQNTCYRMQWGTSQRCRGRRNDDETVDGFPKCENWSLGKSNHSEESNKSWWLNRLISQTKKVPLDWPFPFEEEKLFVLTVTAGLEGFHISVDGRHVTSFPYRTGFSLEEATGLSLSGDINVTSVFATSLPTTHSNNSPQRHLDMSTRWKAPPLLDGPVEMFIGILSAGNHFAERMAVRKSWMQHSQIKKSNVVARFFVALHARKEVNVELKKEAAFFGDIIIVTYVDNYDLVVLKTAAICEYGVNKVAAKNIMKCDDDTFVRLDAIMEQVNKIPDDKSFFVGNMNYYHKPLRSGKWAVTFEEWPESDYPHYANGPGYIISSDIAKFIVSEFDKHRLRLFKMEDVSMGMWVSQFNRTTPVHYFHSTKFCQFGCIPGYYTSHYQSPRQMICLWNKLQELGKPQCCNVR